MNPIFNNLGKSAIGNNPVNMLSQFNQFKNSIKGKDPNQLFNNLINSGKYSQAQIEEAKQLANQFKNFLR